jgi:ferric-dicitrate binding protein FerR (iron transport regulator)
MSLADKEILEVHALCSALADERITAAQQARLGELLKASEEARTIYFHSVSLSASLADYAAEMQADAPFPKVRRVNFKAWTVAALAAAACITLGFFLFQQESHLTPAPHADLADEEMQTNTLVARVSGTKDCVWHGAAMQPGDVIHRSAVLDLTSGVAEVTFDSGAQVVLEGPAKLEAASAWDATLRRGALKATVPPQAVGFRVHHKSVEVVDLGTEFSMVADAGDGAEVRVLKGSVEVSPTSDEESGPLVLKENQTRRFGKNRKAAGGEFEKRHTRLVSTTNLDRWSPQVDLAHWSFDEVNAGVFKGESSGAQNIAEIRSSGAALVDGRWNKALHLDGRVSLTVSAPGLSRPEARTVAFWVRVPEDASLADAQAMIAWPLQSKKLGTRMLRVGWNRTPNQGPLGALRTELGRACAVGTTLLRDGKWHHIAVALVPLGSADGPLQVTQYVDGRLEGTTTRVHRTKLAADAAYSDVLWLGRVPAKNKKDKGRFVGDMDELFIADRVLSPGEIVSLMTANALLRHDIASF